MAESRNPPEKTECIHPGKDPKCRNCPDREENKPKKKYVPPKKTECIHPTYDIKCRDCPDREEN